MKVMRFLLGLAIGAGVALLVAPKSGRELRHQLAGGAGGKLLGAAPDQYPQPEPVAGGGTATAVVEEEPWAPAETGVEDTVVEDAVMAEEAVAEAAPKPFPAWSDEPVETEASDDLRARIDATRTALESELAQPFAVESAERAGEAAAVADEAVVEAAEADVVAEAAVVEAEAADAVAEEAVAEADAATSVAEEAAAEADIADLVADEAVVEAAEADVVAEEAVEEAVVAEGVAEEAEAEEAVADEVVAEAPLAGQEPEPFVGPVPPQLVPDVPASAEPVHEEAPPRKPHAWEIDYDAETTAEVPAADVAAAVAAAAPEPVAEEPAVIEEPVVAEEPAAPVAEEPIVAEEPVVAAAPVAEEPAVIEEPVVAEEPTAPVAEEPEAPAREAGGIDQAEMRRRIEETRARLKAKAFDAMMSGEAALLSRDSGEKPVPSADDVKIDEETGSAIDESLSQEEY